MLFLLFFFLRACLGRFFPCLYLVAGLFLLLLLCVVHAHACDLVADRHDGVAQEHAALGAAHDGEEVLRCLCPEARAVAAVADRLRDAVGAAVDLREDGSEECGAGGAELAVFGIVMLPAIDAEGLADVLLLLRDVVLELGRLTLREEA